jgi:phosphatidylglycerol:prolipoprotein diacylglycerol transferase
MILHFISWNVNPEIFDLGFVAPRWYGLLFASTFFFGYLILQRLFKKEGIEPKVLDKLTTYMLVSTVIGARLGHVVFYDWAYYKNHLIEILYVWQGGLASHGAAIAILIGLYFFAKSEKRPYLWAIDRVVIVTALGGFLIRMGNLMNSEIYGIQTDLPWGFIFVRAGEEVPKHPTQIYEAFSYLLIFFYLLWYYRKKDSKPSNGFLLGMFLILVFGMRFIIEFIKEDQVAFESTMTMNMGQWLSIPAVLGGLYLVWNSRRYHQ